MAGRIRRRLRRRSPGQESQGGGLTGFDLPSGLARAASAGAERRGDEAAGRDECHFSTVSREANEQAMVVVESEVDIVTAAPLRVRSTAPSMMPTGVWSSTSAAWTPSIARPRTSCLTPRLGSPRDTGLSYVHGSLVKKILAVVGMQGDRHGGPGLGRAVRRRRGWKRLVYAGGRGRGSAPRVVRSALG